MIAGKFEQIYDPNVQEKLLVDKASEEQWYYNDHAFVRERETGTWHLFGITHPEPASPLDETRFGHATAETLTQQPWDVQPFALTATRESTAPGEGGEHHIWAPHVLFHEGLYYMFYAGGVVDEPHPHERYKIQVATSENLYDWERSPQNPLFEDGYDARDPHMIRYDDRWVMYYTATTSRSGGNHVVAYRTSDDLIEWGDKRIAFEHPSTGTIAGPTESPCVVRDGEYWYLFVCCEPDYTSTQVYRSTDPFDFEYTTDNVGCIEAHAAEVVRDDDQWYVSGAGWEQGGVYLSPLELGESDG